MRNYFGNNQLEEIDLEKGDHLKNPYPLGFGKVSVPEGQSGEWSISKVVVNEEAIALANLRHIRDGRRDRVVPPGEYSRLIYKDDIVMSDTPAEAHEHLEGYVGATGRVLVNGLGLGFFLNALLQKEDVTEVTVIEKSQDVVRLVSSVFAEEQRVTIIVEDAFRFEPPAGKVFDYVWHDIWTFISGENLPEIEKLVQKYSGIAKDQGAWSLKYL